MDTGHLHMKYLKEELLTIIIKIKTAQSGGTEA